MPGIVCKQIRGALYAFPRIMLPVNAVKVAKENNQTPDTFYCSQLLAEKGIVVIPGYSMISSDNDYFFRMTVLPPENEIEDVMKKIKDFHLNFMEKYSKS